MNFKKVIIHLKNFFSYQIWRRFVIILFLTSVTNVIDGIQCKFSTIDITQDSGGAVYQLFWPSKT